MNANGIENEGRRPSLPPLTALSLTVALAAVAALAVDAGRAAAEPPDDATRAAMARHFGGVGAALYDPANGFEVAADPRRAGGTVICGT